MLLLIVFEYVRLRFLLNLYQIQLQNVYLNHHHLFDATVWFNSGINKNISGPQPYVEEKIDNLNRKVRKLKIVREAVGSNVSKEKGRRLNLAFVYCIKEAMNLRSKIILTEQGTQEVLERRLRHSIKEMKAMSRSNRNIFDFLFEDDSDKEKMKELEEAELSLELTDEEKDELAAAEEPEAVGDTLEDI